MNNYHYNLWPGGVSLCIHVTGRWSCMCSREEYVWLHTKMGLLSIKVETYCIGAIPLDVVLDGTKYRFDLLALAVWRDKAGLYLGPALTSVHEEFEHLGNVSNLTVDVVRRVAVAEHTSDIVQVCESITRHIIWSAAADGQVVPHNQA